MKLPLKFETTSKYIYLLLVLGGFASVVISSSWVAAHWGGVAFGMFLAASVVGWGFLGSFGAEGLAAYWRRRHDAEMLKEVDRLRAEGFSPGSLHEPQRSILECRKDITDWEDRRRG